MSKSKRKARQEKRAAKKENRQAKRADRKERRFQARPMQVIARNQARRQDRKDREQEGITQENLMKAEMEAKEQSRLADVENAEQNAQESGINSGDQLSDIQRMKATKYIQRSGVKAYKDPDLRAAQVLDLRTQEVQERWQPEIDEINNDQTIPEEEKADLMPEEDDIHEEILDEEFDSAQFEGLDADHVDYLDADTLGVLFNVGKSAADKYRQKQFAQGKKAFGKTKQQWEAEQAEKAKGDTVINAAQAAAEEEIKKQKIRQYTPHLIVGGLILVAVMVAVYYKGKKS